MTNVILLWQKCGFTTGFWLKSYQKYNEYNWFLWSLHSKVKLMEKGIFSCLKKRNTRCFHDPLTTSMTSIPFLTLATLKNAIHCGKNFTSVRSKENLRRDPNKLCCLISKSRKKLINFFCQKNRQIESKAVDL